MPALLVFVLVRRILASRRFQEGMKTALTRGRRGDVTEGEDMARGDGEGGGLRRTLLWTVVVLVGLSIVARIVAAVASRRLTHGDETSDEFRAASIMAGRTFHSRAEHLRSGTAVTILGGMALDLTEATLDTAGARLELDTTMGGIQVRVPAYWIVEVDQEGLGGAIEVDVASPEELPEDAPRLHIHAKTRIGGGQVITKKA